MKNSEQKTLKSVALRALANLAESSARSSVTSACGYFVYQPEEPDDMAARLQAMRDGER